MASCQRSVPLLGMGRPQSARYCARTQQARVLRLLPRDSERRRACAARYERSWLGVGRRSWHVAPQSPVKAKRPLANAVFFYGAYADHNQHGTAHVRSKLECCASSQETMSAGARAPRDVRRWLGVEGCRWHFTPRTRAEEERPLAGIVLLLLRLRRPQPARHGAHAPQSRVLRLLSKVSG